MISIIVSSRDEEVLASFRKNVAATVEAEHEIVAIANAQGQYGICEVYNAGAYRSKFEILCFVHEDVSFQTTGWGSKITEALCDPTVGLIGVAGATHKSANVSAWWDTPVQHHRVHIQHPYNRQLTNLNINPDQVSLAEVVALDGVFLATRREIWTQFKFDQERLTGFHFYDIDFSTAVRTKYKVVVTYDISLTHFSSGNPNTADWVDHALVYHKKWRKRLPASVQRKRLVDKFLLERTAGSNIILRSQNIRYATGSVAKFTLRYVRFPYQLMFFLSYIRLWMKKQLR